MYVGVDVRDTKIAIGLVSDKGEVSFQSSLPIDPERGSESVVLDIIYIIKSISETVPFELFFDRLLGIGIGIQGASDKNNENIAGSVNSGLEKIPLQQMIQRHFDIPVFVENHALAESLAENELGALKGMKNIEEDKSAKNMRDTRIISPKTGNEAGIIAAAMICKYLK